jgi:hypothetical protein
MKARHRQYVRIHSRQKQPVVLHLEPWGEEIQMRAGSWLDIAAEGPNDGCIEIEFESENIFVYGWSGSILSVYQNGEVCDCSLPAPALPGNADESLGPLPQEP